MRLTEKDYLCGYDIKDRECFNGYNHDEDRERLFNCLQKLGKLEDIEEELGIDLTIFAKTCLNNKIYSKFWDKYIYFTGETDAITPEGFVCYYAGQNKLYRYEDYGKTWALTEEGLEHEV